jgi:hypothetical protein
MNCSFHKERPAVVSHGNVHLCAECKEYQEEAKRKEEVEAAAKKLAARKED